MPLKLSATKRPLLYRDGGRSVLVTRQRRGNYEDSHPSNTRRPATSYLGMSLLVDSALCWMSARTPYPEDRREGTGVSVNGSGMYWRTNDDAVAGSVVIAVLGYADAARCELPITVMLENTMAPAARMGFRTPVAANAIPSAL
jgi:hypothetical protein